MFQGSFYDDDKMLHELGKLTGVDVAVYYAGANLHGVNRYVKNII